ncbi:MAG: HAMP domain-containing sensor histidine kinase, partial [Bacteroidota bacterium]|nr:HAMP domain-containing sensor histidine kinase [Bacteroidota bacterium]
ISYIGRNYEGDSILSFTRSYSHDSTYSKIVRKKLDSLMTSENEMNPLPSHPSRKPAARPRRPRMMRYTYSLDPMTGNLKIDSFVIERRRNPFPEPDEFSFPDFDNNFQFLNVDSILRDNFAMEMMPGLNNFPFNRPKQQPPDDVRRLVDKARKLQNVIKKLTFEIESHPKPLQQRINKKGLENALKKTLNDNGVEMPFEYAVYSPYNNLRPLPIQSSGFRKDYLSTIHRVSLFPNDLFQKQDYLLLFFPNQQMNLLKSVFWMMIVAVLFTLVVVIATGLAIYALIRQKHISDLKTDFINNMTHEFKTPIATISIAADSISNPKVIENPDKIRNYTRVIKEENSRMNAKIEQVLQMAMLDKSEFRLNFTPIDLNVLIRNSVEMIWLQAERKNGKIITEFSAIHTLILGDESHLVNVLVNLLDNAIKYSPENPEITITTSNHENFIILKVSDKGIGMTREVQKKIFEKFFRVPSGNIHTVKGFGLGLSYCKAIVLAHHGSISVNSEPEKGSTFMVTLPLYEG